MTQVMGLKSKHKYFFLSGYFNLMISAVYLAGYSRLAQPWFPGVTSLSCLLGWSRPVFYVFLTPFRSSVFNGLWIKIHYLFLFEKNIFPQVILNTFLLKFVPSTIVFFLLIKIKSAYLTHSGLWLESHIFLSF
jgi:hypothetical protein